MTSGCPVRTQEFRNWAMKTWKVAWDRRLQNSRQQMPPFPSTAEAAKVKDW